MTFPITDPFTTGAVVTKTQLDVLLNALNVLGADTGWTAGGISAAGSGSSMVSGSVFKRLIGNVVSIQGSVNLGTAITVPSDGNVTNTQVAQISGSASWPAQVQAIGSFGSGPMCQFNVTSAGVINLVATTGGATLGVGAVVSFCGTYLL